MDRVTFAPGDVVCRKDDPRLVGWVSRVIKGGLGWAEVSWGTHRIWIQWKYLTHFSKNAQAGGDDDGN